MSTLELPGEYTFGFVTGRIIQAVADSPADDDRFPEARAATGQITFKPTVELRKSSNHYHAFVGFTTVAAKLDKLGRLVDDQTWKAIQDGEISGDDPDGPHGIWLVTGSYNVTPSVIGARIAPFTVEVTAEHTEANPLDLVTAAPPQPAPGVTLQTLMVPPGGAPDETLVRDAGGNLTWSSVAYDSAQDAQAALAAIPSEVTTELAAQVPPAVTAELATQGIVVDTTAGTKVTVGGVVVHYDSGWRDISSLLGAAWKQPTTETQHVEIKRTLDRVYFRGKLAPETPLTAQHRILNAPSWAVPDTYSTHGVASQSTRVGVIRNLASPAGIDVITTAAWDLSDVLFTAEWSTSAPFPTTLSGTPA